MSGARVQLNEYDPWGAVSRSEGSIDPDQRFTGQKLDPETGLYYYGGRYYDAEIGRFISADPFIQTPYEPQNLNRYSYVVNNPQNHTDPSGYFHKIVKKKPSFWSRFGGFFIGAIVGILSGGAGMPAVLAGAIGGFVGGAVNSGGTTGSPLRSVLGGAFLGGLGGAIGGAAFEGLGGIVGEGFTLGNFGATVGAAAISGAITGAVATGIYGGNFGKNVGFGALGSAISAAVVYGGMAAWNALNGNGGAQTANSGRSGLEFADARDAIQRNSPATSMNDASPNWQAVDEFIRWVEHVKDPFTRLATAAAGMFTGAAIQWGGWNTLAASYAIYPVNPVAGIVGSFTGLGLVGLGFGIELGSVWIANQLLPTPQSLQFSPKLAR